MSFYHYVELKQKNTILKENEPGPSRKLPYLDEFLLVLMRLKAGLFVQDVAEIFGISNSFV